MKSTGEGSWVCQPRARLKQSSLIQIRLASYLWLVHPAKFSKLYCLNCAQLAGWKSFEKYPEIASHQGASVKNTDCKWAGRGWVSAGSPCHGKLSEGVPELFPKWAAQLLKVDCGLSCSVSHNAGDVFLKSCEQIRVLYWNNIFQLLPIIMLWLLSNWSFHQ